MTYLFWILLGTILYTYAGYTLLLLIISWFKRPEKQNMLPEEELPHVTIVIAAYNEKDILEEKIKNSNQLNYPSDKLTHLWVTDGSTDGSEELLRTHSNLTVLHNNKRGGKMAAINRAMPQVKTPITVFCDANTMLHPDSIRWMAASLAEKNVGCVAGEKSIVNIKKDSAAGSGESSYWSYESYLKKLESKVGSTVGAAGELFALRTDLFEAPNADTVVDDFVITLRIAQNGYKIAYQPKAIASEKASFSIKEERKRKIRIAAGSFQVLFGMPELFNFFKHSMLSFQYLSHKVLRWLIVPIAIPILFLLNAAIVYTEPTNKLFQVLLALQLLFYLFVVIGILLNKKKIQLKFLFMPYYLVMMNHAIVLGFIRFIKGSQNAAWEKAKRQT